MILWILVLVAAVLVCITVIDILNAYKTFGAYECEHIDDYYPRKDFCVESMAAYIWCSGILVACPDGWKDRLLRTKGERWKAGEKNIQPFTGPLVTVESMLDQVREISPNLVEWIVRDKEIKEVNARIKGLKASWGWEPYSTYINIRKELVSQKYDLERKNHDHVGIIAQEVIPDYIDREYLSLSDLQTLRIDLPDLHGDTIPPKILEMWKTQYRNFRGSKYCKRCAEMAYGGILDDCCC